ncbi:putative short-chain dehydrogenase/reductase SDR, NAD(P)-binding domain superfamily [Plasmopara halstedii]
MQPITKTVLITGSTRSIGLALAKYYANANWNVIGTARANSSTDQLKALSPSKIVTLDTSDEASIFEAAQQLKDVPIDLLINNAGLWIHGDFMSSSKEDMMRHYEVNTVGPFLTTRALLPNLKLAAQTNGAAYVAQLNTTLGSISNNTPKMEAFFSKAFGYTASKAALNMVTRSMAVSLRKSNIGLVTINPGYVSTDMTNHKGYLKPSESAEAMANILANLTLKDSGKFLNSDKKIRAIELPW